MSILCGGKVYLVSAFVEGMGTTLLGFKYEEGVKIEGRPLSSEDLLRAMQDRTPIYVDYMFSQLHINNRGDIAWAERGVPELRSAGCWMIPDKIIYFDDDLSSKDVAAIESTIQQVEEHRYQRRTGLSTPKSGLIVPGR